MRPLFDTMIIQLGLELGTPRKSKGSSLTRRFSGPPCAVEAALRSLAAYQFTGSPGTVAGLRFVWKLIGLGAAASVSVCVPVRNFRRPLAPEIELRGRDGIARLPCPIHPSSIIISSPFFKVATISSAHENFQISTDTSQVASAGVVSPWLALLLP